MGGRNSDLLMMAAIVAAGVATGGVAFAAAPAALGAAGAAAATAGTAAAAGSAFSITGALAGGALAAQLGGTLMQGQAASYQAKVQQGQQELQLSADQTQASIAEEQRQRGLRSMLSTHAAIVGASGVDTGEGLAQQAIGAVNRNTNLASVSGDVNEAQALAGIGQSAYASQVARTGSYVKAAGSLMQFASKNPGLYS